MREANDELMAEQERMIGAIEGLERRLAAAEELHEEDTRRLSEAERNGEGAVAEAYKDEPSLSLCIVHNHDPSCIH